MEQYYQEKLKELRLIDDDFMNIALNENKKAVEKIIQIILEKQIKLEEVHTQEKIQNLTGSSIILDIYAKDEKENEYNIEIQRQVKGAHPKRLRYNAALIDMRQKIKEGYRSLKDTYIIILTEKDYFKEKKAKYQIKQKIEETNKDYYDGVYKIYVNLEYEGEDEIGELIHDIKCREAKEMKIKELKETVETFKNTKKGKNKMCKVFEEIREKGRQEERAKMSKVFEEIREKGRQEERAKIQQEIELKEKELIRNMYISGLTIEMIARIANISIDKTRKILKIS